MSPQRVIENPALVYGVLVQAGSYAAQRPTVRSRAEAFRRAAERAFRTPFPAEPVEPFYKLTGIGRAWLALDDRGRASNAEAVEQLALRCGAILGVSVEPAPAEPRPPEPPPPRFRADIDG